MGLGHFSFGTKEACRMRGETSSRNLKKSFTFQAPYKESKQNNKPKKMHQELLKLRIKFKLMMLRFIH